MSVVIRFFFSGSRHNIVLSGLDVVICLNVGKRHQQGVDGGRIRDASVPRNFDGSEFITDLIEENQSQ